MKLNGALKPRQGASVQGSSPGVVLRKYRGKRYNNKNENVVNGLPLNECGVNNNNNNYNEDYNINQDHQQQTKCGENCSSLCSLSSSTLNNTTQYRITTAAVENIDYISHGSRKVAPTETTINHNNKDVVNFKPTQQKHQHPVYNNNNNITTRQVKNNNINKENNNGEKKIRKQEQQKEAVEISVAGVAGVAITTTTTNTSKYHVTTNKTNKNSNSCNNNNNDILHCKEVNKFSLISKFYENQILRALAFLTVVISWLLIQFKLLLFSMFSHTENSHLTGNRVDGGLHSDAGGSGCGGVSVSVVAIVNNKSNKIMRASQSFKESFERICFKNVYKSRLTPSFALYLMVYAAAAAAILLPQAVVGDDGDNFYPINGLETTTPEFDYASRGQKKFGDKCENTLECGFPGSTCDPKKKSCQCTEDLPVTNHFDKCGKEAAVNESCFFNEQCEVKYFQTECRDQRCVCRFDMSPIWLKDGTVECKGRGEKKVERYVDPAMIGVLIGMALMFIIICVVLRLFSQARWHENRTIFNTPNPRLMNVSLLRESKLLHGQERRGSRMSVRAPSRQPSMASLRPHSPNPSLGKTGSRSNSNSHGSNASATSLRSTRGNSVSPAGIVVNNTHHERKGSTYQPHHHHHQQQQQHHPHTQHQQLSSPQQQQHHHNQQDEEHEQKQPLAQTNIISNPVAESITVEIIEPEK